MNKLKIRSDLNHYATQCLSGHGNLKSKLFKFALKEDPWCQEFGQGVEDTALHTLAECPTFNESREDIIPFLTGTSEIDKPTLVTMETF